MKLLLVGDDGSVIDALEDIGEYDLEKPMARAVIVEEIQRMLRIAQAKGEGADETHQKN